MAATQQIPVVSITIPNDLLNRVRTLRREPNLPNFTPQFSQELTTQIQQFCPSTTVTHYPTLLSKIGVFCISKKAVVNARQESIDIKLLATNSENFLADIKSAIERTFEALRQTGGKLTRKGKKSRKSRKSHKGRKSRKNRKTRGRK